MLNATIQQVIHEMKSHPFTLLAVLALVAVSVWGYSNYARAADTETLKRELKQEISALEQRVATNNTKIDRVLKLQLAEAIRGIQRQICSTNDNSARANLQQTLDGLQDDYEEVNGDHPYEVQRCSS